MKKVPLSATVAVVVAAVLGFFVTWQEPAFGQAGTTVEQRLGAIEGELKALRQEVQQLVKTLQSRPAPQTAGAAAAAPAAPVPLPATIRIGGAPVLGRADAKLTIVEFSDFECPFCGRFQRDTFPQLKAEYIDAGKVRYVFRNFPLESIHPRAMQSAEAGACAHAQGKFWPMHDRLYANQQALAEINLVAHAQTMGLDMTAFRQCLAGQSIGQIRQDLEEGGRGGITGTPGFFIGTAGPDGTMKVLRRIVGAQPYASFKALLDALLASPQAAGG